MSTTVVELSVQHAPEVLGTSSQLTAKITRLLQGDSRNRSQFSGLASKTLSRLKSWSSPKIGPASKSQLTLNETADERAELNNAYCEWETQLEHQYAQDILSGKETTLDNYHLNQALRAAGPARVVSAQRPATTTNPVYRQWTSSHQRVSYTESD